jgi:hypothetical protein
MLDRHIDIRIASFLAQPERPSLSAISVPRRFRMDEELGSRVYREYRWFALVLAAIILGCAMRLTSGGTAPGSTAAQPAQAAAGLARR